ncbi:oxygen-independent coproporphyrinogen III oxidase [Alkalicaulis satelles]|uniref:Coproporphyrinogen-III oxidase n=1 Tax=Alkalicaulis satelles TaxID=2609175 RepID=A0A5M6ZJ01_9PROT|nr:oxygen-independent coproporphyrinogen III oxidase [Alkalicaulis satelles]KAA5803734.1 oxygen-independent coproporphyrinogen III oxidase [Alkalicaulis satelles]
MSRRATLLRHANARTPRYTSYPTAPHFHEGVDGAVMERWLGALDPARPVSLYVHVPYCRSLCWYCGCNTRATTRAEPVAAYLERLLKELELTAARLPGRMAISHFAMGGGTPAILSPDQISRLMDAVRARFDLLPGAELSIEIDPRHFTRADAVGLARNGFTRASTGVQSFDPAVQAAINRIQPWELAAIAFDRLREAGVGAINIDLLYGLPRQSAASARASAEAAADLAPDRLAVFGYAHVPHMMAHQRLIRDEELPDARSRLDQADAMEDALLAAGYQAIGIDHYALPGDSMARALKARTLKRNFQGYTTDPSDVLIGLGASAISALPHGYVQAHSDVRAWGQAVEAGRLPARRGVAVSAQDRLRRAIIEQLMTYLDVDPAALAAAHGLAEPEADLSELEAAGIVRRDGARIIVPRAYRPLARLAAAAFDGYLPASAARHSVSV